MGKLGSGCWFDGWFRSEYGCEYRLGIGARHRLDGPAQSTDSDSARDASNLDAIKHFTLAARNGDGSDPEYANRVTRGDNRARGGQHSSRALSLHSDQERYV